MKAEERKENETNALRVWMEHKVERFKGGRAVYLLVGCLVLAVGTAGFFWYLRVSRAAANSARDMELNAADTEPKLGAIINAASNQGKPVVVWAKLQKARLALYSDGLTHMGSFTDEDRNKAITKVEDGRKRYLEIVNELKEEALKQEAYFSLARAEETLCGIPKLENSTEYRGSLPKAVEYYQKAAAINPNSEASKKYAGEAERLKGKRDEIEDFYRKLNLLGFTPPPPKKPIEFGPDM